MAKVNLPLLSGEVRGKIGNVIFFKRNGKQLARVRTIPSNPRSEKQMAVRNNMAGLSKLFKGEGNITLRKPDGFIVVENGLTEEERRMWKEFSKSRSDGLNDGRLLFIGKNLERLNNNLDFMRIPE